ncbi:MAG TPA: SH3 domain-containing protein, partial [Candidatus Dormibacteraeota bacterium]|nr:SH3 domain-containing protein [Candidatus Dormibacteraeota bacterium]
KTSLSMSQIFWSDPKATKTYATTFASTRTVGKTGILDPYAPGKYYRSIVADLGMTAAAWRSGSTLAAATTTVRYVGVAWLNLRSGPGTGDSIVAVLPYDTRLVVYKSSNGWLYVRIPDPRYGWVYAAYTR